MPTTVLQFFSDALADVGVTDAGQTPSGGRIQFARRRFNDMVNSWSSKRLRLFFIPEAAYMLQGGKGTYQIGPGGTEFDTSAGAYVKPVFIQAASVIVGTARRFGLNLLTRPEWNLNNAKTLTDPDGPWDIFYDYNSPLATINVAPKPISAQQLLVSQWNPLKIFNEGDEALNMEDYYPPEYFKPLRYGLAIELAPTHHFPVSQDLAGLFQSGITEIERVNNDKLSGAYSSSRTLDGPVKGDGSPVGQQQAPQQQ